MGPSPELTLFIPALAAVNVIEAEEVVNFLIVAALLVVRLAVDGRVLR